MTAASEPRGAQAERIACRYLEKHGLQLVTRNYRCRGGEIDLLMRHGQLLVVVEVRHRRGQRFGGAAASIDTRKQRRLILAAQDYLARHPAAATTPVRFDVLALDGDIAAPAVDWIRDAFRPDWP